MQIKYGIKAVIIVVVGCGLRVANPREDEILIAARNNSCQQHVGDWPRGGGRWRSSMGIPIRAGHQPVNLFHTKTKLEYSSEMISK